MTNQQNTTDDEKRASVIAGLRACAAFLEAHPGVPTPSYSVLNVFLKTREDLAPIARAASWDKVHLADWFCLSRAFSEHLKLEVNVPRAAVCRRVVTGTTTIAARPEQIVEQVEWVCEEPLLAEGGAR
jgi:hypothetical protein